MGQRAVSQFSWSGQLIGHTINPSWQHLSASAVAANYDNQRVWKGGDAIATVQHEVKLQVANSSMTAFATINRCTRNKHSNCACPSTPTKGNDHDSSLPHRAGTT